MAKKIGFFCAFALFLNLFASAQPLKDGALSVTGASVLNRYSPLTSDVTAGTSTLAVLNQTATLKLCAGDLILIYQAQGASMSTTNALGYGAVTAYNSAGLYEFMYVKETSANTIVTTSTISNSYLASGMSQVLRVPQYSTLTVNANASITASPWRDTLVASVNYRFGGIAAIHASHLVNNGFITADAKGFRGGASDPSTFGTTYTTNISSYVTAVSTHGGEKGESIIGYSSDYDLLGGRYGRGAPANGGGGGNAWNSGGGGGANASSGAVWTGQGVMSGTVIGAAAWGLDPGFIANGNMLCTSSGGGRGGYSVGLTPNNPLAVPPGDAQWTGDNRQEVGGLGGRPLAAEPKKRLFFGGGGGAGDENNFCSNNGGNGGGLVFAIATIELSGSGLISSIGGTGGNTKNTGVDAPSGGGGGGSIVVLSPSISATQTLSVKGGHGGSQFISSTEAQGPGGGGGAGYIVSTTGSLFLNTSGGDNGQTYSPMMTGFPSNGATHGAKGEFTTTPYSFIAYNVNSIVTAAINSPICRGETFSLSANGPSNVVYTWAGPNNFSSGAQNPQVVNTTSASSGVYTLAIASEGCTAIKITVNAAFALCNGLEESYNSKLAINIWPSPANESITILSNSAQLAELKIYDAKGVLCLTNKLGANAATLDLRAYSNGLYTLIITDVYGRFSSKKMMVSH